MKKLNSTAVGLLLLLTVSGGLFAEEVHERAIRPSREIGNEENPNHRGKPDSRLLRSRIRELERAIEEAQARAEDPVLGEQDGSLDLDKFGTVREQLLELSEENEAEGRRLLRRLDRVEGQARHMADGKEANVKGLGRRDAPLRTSKTGHRSKGDAGRGERRDSRAAVKLLGKDDSRGERGSRRREESLRRKESEELASSADPRRGKNRLGALSDDRVRQARDQHPRDRSLEKPGTEAVSLRREIRDLEKKVRQQLGLWAAESGEEEESRFRKIVQRRRVEDLQRLSEELEGFGGASVQAAPEFLSELRHRVGEIRREVESLGGRRSPISREQPEESIAPFAEQAVKASGEIESARARLLRRTEKLLTRVSGLLTKAGGAVSPGNEEQRDLGRRVAAIRRDLLDTRKEVAEPERRPGNDLSRESRLQDLRSSLKRVRAAIGELEMEGSAGGRKEKARSGEDGADADVGGRFRQPETLSAPVVPRQVRLREGLDRVVPVEQPVEEKARVEESPERLIQRLQRALRELQLQRERSGEFSVQIGIPSQEAVPTAFERALGAAKKLREVLNSSEHSAKGPKDTAANELSVGDRQEISRLLTEFRRTRGSMEELRSAERLGDSLALKSTHADFEAEALTGLGTFSGEVTDSLTEAPLQSVAIDIFDSAGNLVNGFEGYGYTYSYTYTDASGSFSWPGLDPGDHFVRTRNFAGYDDELYDNLPCEPDCDPLTGTPVAAVADTTTSGIDFGLSNPNSPGRILGSVKNAATNAPVLPTNVYFYDAGGGYVGYAQVDAAGNFVKDNLPPAQYFVRTYNYSSYWDKLYDDIVCEPWCDVTTGAPVTVAGGEATTGIDFLLDLGGSIAGRLTDAATGDPIPYHRIDIYDSSGAGANYAYSDASGDYSTDNPVDTGSYFAKTIGTWSGYSRYLKELYDDIPCHSGCTITAGSPIAVVDGSPTIEIDFQLDLAGSISGVVTRTDTGAPVEGVFVDVFDPSGGVAFQHYGYGYGYGYGYTDASGSYSAFGLPTGTYTVRTGNYLGLQDELFDNLPCPSAVCDVTSGTPVAVTEGSETSGTDFALEVSRPGSISGTVTEEMTGDPIAGVKVQIYDFDGDPMPYTYSYGYGYTYGYSYTDSAGSYTVAPVPPGSYFAATESGYLDEVFDDTPCEGGCNVTIGDSLLVTAGNATSGVDFALGEDLGPGSISGTVTDAATGAPLSGVSIRIYDSTGTEIPPDYGYGYGYTDGSGSYSVTDLAPGTYFARTQYGAGYVDELYDDLPCSWGSCTYTSGTPIVVASGAATTGIDFALAQGGTITGTMTDAATGSPISPWSSVFVYDASGNYVTGRSAPPWSGVFTVNGLATGLYYLRTSSRYDDELYDDLACEGGCTVTVGTAVSVTAGSTTSGIDFALGALGKGAIAGAVTDDVGGAGISGVWVDIFDSAGNLVNGWEGYGYTYGYTYSDSTGSFAWGAMDPGIYYARTRSNTSYQDELWDNLPCEPDCDPVTGTPIAVVADAVTTADFGLFEPQPGAISGTVTDVATGSPLSGIYIVIHNSNGDWWRDAYVDASGSYTVAGLVPGTYFARAAASAAGYVDELYDNLPCTNGQCTYTSGTPVVVDSGATTTGIDFALAEGGTITGLVTDKLTGAAVTGWPRTVYLYDGAGNYLDQQNSDPWSGGAYTFDGLPSGNYYLRTETRYDDELYDGLPCEGGCTETDGTAVAVAEGATTSGINFMLRTAGKGSIGGTVTDDVTANPISGVAIDIFDSAGSQVNTYAYSYGGYSYSYTDSVGSFGWGPLPPGTYYAHTRSNSSHQDELWDGLPCEPSCSPVTGTPIVVVADAGTTADFALHEPQPGSISGLVTEEATGTPIAGAGVDLFDSSGYWFSYAYSDSSGNYAVAGVTPGTYYARAYAGSGYVQELYNDIPCPLGNCTYTSGTPIVVVSGATVTGVDFALAAGGTITGTVIDELTGAPVAGWPRIVELYDSAGTYLGERGTSPWDGGSYSFYGLAAGDYFLRTDTFYDDELYNDLPCEGGCIETDGTPVVVTGGATTSGIDFLLRAAGKGSIAGTVTDDATANPISGVAIDIFDAAGNQVNGYTYTYTYTYSYSYSYTDSAGSFGWGPLPPGTYYARTRSNSAYEDELWDDLPCEPTCNATAGTPIVVAADAATTADFALYRPQPGAISGTVTDAATGGPISGVSITIYDSGNSWSSYGYTDAAGNYTASGLMPGTYFARSRNWAGFVDELYDDQPCPYEECTPTNGTPIVVTSGTTTSGIDFALATGGTISGSVVDELTGAPVAGWPRLVILYDSAGSYVSEQGSRPWDGGAFAFNGLPPGDYHLRTDTNYDDELFDDLPCEGGCAVTAGTLVPVTAGSTTSGIDFMLGASGTGAIIGAVSDDLTGAGVPDTAIDIFDSAGNQINGGYSYSYSYTDSSGSFGWGALAPGTYYARTRSGTSYQDELWDNLPCEPTCDPVAGTPIVVVADAATTADFGLLSPGNGAIAGLVTSSSTDTPLAGVEVRVYDDGGSHVGDVTSDAGGAYAAGGLAPGTYYVRTRSTSGYADELFNDLPCWGFWCDMTSGAPIVVAADSATTGIDFALDPAGHVAGHVSDAVTGGAVASGQVTLYDSSGDWIGVYAYLDSSGDYLSNAVPPGEYRARAWGWDGYLSELYDDIPCWNWCNESTGTPIAVVAGATTTGIDFALDKSASIAGVVTDAATGGPIADAGVDIYDSSGSNVGYGYTDATGAYTAGGFGTGDFFARVYEYSVGYLSELYDDRLCEPDCDVTTGDPIPAVAGAATTGIDFALRTGGSISGIVTDAGTGDPLQHVDVEIYDPSGNWITSGSADASGIYTAGGLLGGTYFARTSNGEGYLDELFDDRLCEPWCDETGGDPIVVVLGAATTGVDFALDKGGSITGVVTDVATGDPVTSGRVIAYDSDGNRVGDDYLDANGEYEIGGLPAGSYHARTDTWSGYLDELYDDIPCWDWCNINSGAPIAVTLSSTTAGIDFALQKGGSITGVITDAATGDPVPAGSVEIHVYDSSGSSVAYGSTDAAGAYTVDGLPSGSFTARTWIWSGGYLGELYDDISCWNGCDETAGTAIPVVAGTTTSGIDFALDKGGSISGIVTDAATGAPVPDVRLEIFTSSGQRVNWNYGYSDATGAYTAVGLPTGVFHARTDARSEGYLDELYDDIPCWQGCYPTDGASIAVVQGATTTGVDFALDKGGSVSGVVTDAATGAPVTDGWVIVYDASGSWFNEGYLDGGGAYEVSGLPTGTYYLQINNWSGYLDELYDDIPCWYDCSITSGNPIAVVQGATTTGVDFALDKGGSISGAVIDAVTGDPIPGGRVRAYDEKGRNWGDDWPGGSGAYEIGGLPPGTYYLALENWSGYVDEYYDGVPAAGQPCERTGTIGIPVALSEDVTGIDFTLERGARPGGVVVDADTGQGIPDIEVSIYDAWGDWITYGYTDASGSYSTAASLPDGTYFARTYNWSGYLDELWDGVPCWDGCEETKGHPIIVASGSLQGPIDFSLDKGGTIAGKVTDENTGAHIIDGYVSAYDENGGYGGSAYLFDGNPYEIMGLPAGFYRVVAYAWDGYLAELYDDIPCAGGSCDPSTGAAVAVTLGATTGGIDFALGTGGSISGSVTDAATGAPIASVELEIFDSNGEYVGYGYTDNAGSYTASGLPAGTLYAHTESFWSSRGYIDELYDDIPCHGGGCDPTTGTGISVAHGAETTGIDFALEKGGSISGAVVDADTGAPIGEGYVSVYDASGQWMRASWNSGSIENGVWRFGGLPAGTYYAKTDFYADYLDELYPNIPCADGCDVTAGSPITVTAGVVTPGIDFAVEKGTAIRGSVVDGTTGAPVRDARVFLYDTVGDWVDSDRVDRCGEYEFDQLGRGESFYLHTSNEAGYLDELFDDRPCPLGDCDPGAGIPVTTPLSGGSASIADFALDKGGRLEGTIVDQYSGAPIPDVCVDVWDASGDWVDDACTGASGEYMTSRGLASGDYFASTTNTSGYDDELYDDKLCPGGACDKTAGDPVGTGPGVVATGIDFALALSCFVPADLVLDGQTIVTAEVFEAENSILLTDFEIAAPGEVTLRADGVIALGEGVSVGTDANLTIFNAPPEGGCP